MSEVLELEPDEGETHFLYDHLRSIWKPDGMVYHVPECPRKDRITSIRVFLRHWKSVHVSTIVLYVCDHLDCLETPVFKAKNVLCKHSQHKHKLSVEEARSLVATCPTRKEANFKFVNLPPKRLSDMFRQHQQIGVMPDLEGKGSISINAVCRDKYVMFDPVMCQPIGKECRRRRRRPTEATLSRASDESQSGEEEK